MADRVVLSTLLVSMILLPGGGWTAPMGTAFTYQGTLADGSSPANGSYDFRLALFDADYAGSQVGGILYKGDAVVTDGLVTLQLDFGAVFDGTALWLEVSLRDGASTGGYTVLAPRQELTPTPQAVHSQHSASADTATTASNAANAAQLNGEAPGYYLSWSNFTGVPTSLLDGDDDTLDGLSCGAGEIARWSGSAWSCSTAADAYLRTYVVGPVGTATENGTALLAALAAIPTPTSQEEGALLDIEPGLYDLGALYLTMKPWVDVQGSGIKATKITGSVCGQALVETASDAELRDLMVENTCAGASATAIGVRMGQERSSLRQVKVEVLGEVQDDRGVLIESNQAQLLDVAAVVANASSECVAILSTAPSLGMVRVGASAYGDETANTVAIKSSGGWAYLGEVTAYAAYGATATAVESTGPFLELQDVKLFAQYGTTMTGLAAVDVYKLRMSSVNIRMDGGTGIVITEYDSNNVTFHLHDVVMDVGPGWGEVATGIRFDTDRSTVQVIVDNCFIRGTTNTLDLNGPYDLVVQVGSSRLAGGPSSMTGGTLTCAGVFDESNTFYASSCP